MTCKYCTLLNRPKVNSETCILCTEVESHEALVDQVVYDTVKPRNSNNGAIAIVIKQYDGALREY